MHLVVVVAAAVVMYVYYRRTYSRFAEVGVKHFTPIPFLGNVARLALRLEHLADTVLKIYNGFGAERFVGYYELGTPMIMVRDIGLLSKIAIKDFDHFCDHQQVVDDSVDPLFGRNLFSLRGLYWKKMKSSLTPALTISKAKRIMPFLISNGDRMIRSLKIKLEKMDGNSLEIDTKDISTRYANDAIAAYIYDIDINSFVDDNKFFTMSRKISTFSFLQVLIILGYRSIPRIMKALNIVLMSEKARIYYKTVLLQSFEIRETFGKKTKDIIDCLMKANLDYPEDDLSAQAAFFLIAGFESVSNVTTFLLYELALNRDIQDKLYQEIEDNKNNHEFLDYDAINEMVYLNKVVLETLRKWSPGTLIDRICTKEYNLGRPNDGATKDYIIRKGEGISIPVWGIHHDPEYYPDPYRFDPERFSKDNTNNLRPYTFLSFGIGPRSCMGQNVALLEIKTMMYQLLQHVIVLPSSKTSVPLKLSPENLNLRIKGGHWLEFKLRNVNNLN